MSFIVLLELKSHITEGSHAFRNLNLVINDKDTKNNKDDKIIYKEETTKPQKEMFFKPNISSHNSLRLLKDNELKNGETVEGDIPAPDVIIRYDGGMFGYVDSEPNLHIWRAPFVPFGTVWPQPLSIRYGKDVYVLCERSSKLDFKLTGITNYILEGAISRYNSLICTNKFVSHYTRHSLFQEKHLDNVHVGGKLLTENIHNHYQFNKQQQQQQHQQQQEHYQQQQHAAFYQSSDDIMIIKASKRARLLGHIDSVRLLVHDKGDSWPSLNMNESYQIIVNTRGIEIEAKETWGALRALETLSQLIWRTRSGRLFINESRVQDQPRFRHRALMLDTARHFIPKTLILKNLDAMAMNKLNVFHWHITDDQSFPLVTDNHPEFSKYGSYDPVHKVYKVSDVKEIIEYARQRGIRVIPEIDLPSHSLSWRYSHPEVMTRCLDSSGRWTGYYGPVNMAAENTYRLLQSLFRDIVHLFPDRWIHIGSDEVATGCIESNQAIQNWMHQRGMFSADALTDLFTRKLQNIITSFGKSDPDLKRNFIVWQEAYDRNSVLKKGTIIQLWKSQSTSEAAVLARQKIPVIYSACWYLDRLEYGAQWATHYQCDPTDDSGGSYGSNEYDQQAGPKMKVKQNGDIDDWKKYVLGGEAAMWNEFFDSDNVLQRIWPLAGAAAERLWSPSYVNIPDKAAPRIEEMRCRMLLRTIPTGVASGAGNCPQINENNLGDSQNVKFQNSFSDEFHLSQINSLRLMSQLIQNGFQYNMFPIILLVMVTIICIYLRIYIHMSTRKMMYLLIFIMTLYTFGWITTQNMTTRNIT